MMKPGTPEWLKILEDRAKLDFGTVTNLTDYGVNQIGMRRPVSAGCIKLPRIDALKGAKKETGYEED